LDSLHPDTIYIPVVDGIECALKTLSTIEPKTLTEALQRPDGNKYLDSAIEEVHTHLENGTWKLVQLPQGKQAISSQWVFKIKQKSDGTIDKYKGQIIARGYMQGGGGLYRNICTNCTFWCLADGNRTRRNGGLGARID
jgi:hypothetical protein